MKQIDPNLSAENFALELADLQEVIFVLRASFSAKIFRPICLISIRKHINTSFVGSKKAAQRDCEKIAPSGA